jgi:hypothetical protein
VTWIAWASVAGVASFLVLAHYASFRSINLFSRDALLAVLAIIVAAVTVFYPILLNRTFDQSQRTLEQVKGLQESNSQVLRDLRYLEADSELLRRAVLLPLITHITLSSQPPGSAPDWSETLQVQATALRLILAESPTEFRGRWVDFRGYPESSRNQVAYFAEKAERHLADLVKHQPWQLDEREIGELRDALRGWGKAARI